MFPNKSLLEEKNYLVHQKRLSDYSLPVLFSREERQQKHNYFRSAVVWCGVVNLKVIFTFYLAEQAREV